MMSWISPLVVFSFAWLFSVSVPHLMPHTVFPLTPSRPSRMFLYVYTISLDTEYSFCFDLYLGFNDCYGACFWARTFPTTFSSHLFRSCLFCLDFREHLDWFSLFFFVVLLPASRSFVLLSGIDWSWPAWFLSASSALVFSFGFKLPGWRPCSHSCYATILQRAFSFPPALLLVFATTLGVSDPAELNKTIFSANVSSIIYRWTTNNFLCECVLNNLLFPLLQWCSCSCFLLVGFSLVFLFGPPFLFLVSS